MVIIIQLFFITCIHANTNKWALAAHHFWINQSLEQLPKSHSNEKPTNNFLATTLLNPIEEASHTRLLQLSYAHTLSQLLHATTSLP